MLQRWGVDVVMFGPSLDDEDSYYLIRAYPSLEERQRKPGRLLRKRRVAPRPPRGNRFSDRGRHLRRDPRRLRVELGNRRDSST